MARGEINITVAYKTVFLVESGEYQSQMVDGIFSSEKLAQAYIDKRKEVDECYGWRDPAIVDYTLDKGFVPHYLDTVADGGLVKGGR